MSALQRKKSTAQAKKRAVDPTPNSEPVLFLSTGSTMANLAMSNYAHGGYPMGKIINGIGDSHTGKTYQALSALAEAAYTPAFDNHSLFFDDAEYASEFDIPYLFGVKTADRITIPECPSESVEEFFVNVMRMLDSGKPFIYILDTLDALYSKEDEDRAKELDAKIDTNEAISGTYGQGIPKTMSWMLRMIRSKIRKTNSLLIIISQTRTNLGFGAKFKPKTRSGGVALQFYSAIVYWLSVVHTHKTGPKGDQLRIGADVEMRITKNKITGHQRAIQFPLYTDIGVDDITSCIDYLLKQGQFEKSGNSIIPHGLFSPGECEEKMTKAKLIQVIERDNLEPTLSELAEHAWLKREELAKMSHRKRKYS